MSTRARSGLGLEELVQRVIRTNAPIASHDLLAWLLGSKLATLGPDQLLRPTAAALELAGGLEQL
jgi:hypothetical protein